MSVVEDMTDSYANEKTRILDRPNGGKWSLSSPFSIPCRYVLAVMSFMGFINVYTMRVNLSVAMVAMAANSHDSRGDNSTANMGHLNLSTSYYSQSSSGNHAEFDWSEQTQGYVLGAFYYGYIIPQMVAGWLAARIGGKMLFGFSLLTCAIMCILSPIVVRTSVYLFIALRVLQGLSEGCTFPVMHAMWGDWAPRWERSKLAVFAYAGMQIGNVIALPISGVLCNSDFAGGWPSVFYVFGAATCVWFMFWMLLVHDTPASHPRISSDERDFIQRSLGQKEILPTPWKDILLSPAVWAVGVSHFANNWQYYTLLTCMPTYTKYILKFDLVRNGVLSAMPFAACWIASNISGLIADYIRENGYLSTKNTRKVFNTLGLFVPAMLLVAVGFLNSDSIVAPLALLTLSVGLGSLTMAGYNVNHLDIAPRFAGVLMGVTNSMATLAGIIGPVLVGYLTNHNQTRQQWQIVFNISAVINVVGMVVYIALAQGEELPWAKAASKDFQSVKTESSTAS